MKTFDELKKNWDETPEIFPGTSGYNQASFEKIVKSRVKKHMGAAMQYFWASLALQIIVYALLSHVVIRYWADREMLLWSILGVILFLPFTIMLMKKFKAIAGVKPESNSGSSLQHYVLQRQVLLQNFYLFKKRYELILIPLSSIIGIFLMFKLYLPGGVNSHPLAAAITLTITLISCIGAIRAENKKSFKEPLRHLREMQLEFSGDPGSE